MCHAVDIILTMVYDKIITGILDVCLGTSFWYAGLC